MHFFYLTTVLLMLISCKSTSSRLTSQTDPIAKVELAESFDGKLDQGVVHIELLDIAPNLGSWVRLVGQKKHIPYNENSSKKIFLKGNGEMSTEWIDARKTVDLTKITDNDKINSRFSYIKYGDWHPFYEFYLQETETNPFNLLSGFSSKGKSIASKVFMVDIMELSKEQFKVVELRDSEGAYLAKVKISLLKSDLRR